MTEITISLRFAPVCLAYEMEKGEYCFMNETIFPLFRFAEETR